MSFARYIWGVGLLLWVAFVLMGYGVVPPLGPLLDARMGIWQHQNIELQSQELPALKAPVVITIDQYGVPHFFAASEKDLYLAQGFMTASQRLFQLDVNTRQTAGRLTEMFGPRALPFDEFFVRFGMRQSAAHTLRQYTADPRTNEMLEAYVAGINSYIERMPQLPPEYKILGVRPEPFDVQRVLHMGKALTWSLSGRSFDPHLSKYQQILGAADVLDLFPEYLPAQYEDFVFPERLGRPHGQENPAQFSFVSGLKDVPKFPFANPGRGSNNWVVGPAKSATGTSLFANDTHLTLTLPSTWYESQLSCPEFNVYGVSLVGVPGIVNGLNKDIAWGPTNGTTDVLDFFEIEFEHESSLRYKWNGGWEQAVARQEVIQLKPFGSSVVDVVETKLGMLLHREGRLGLVADWTGHRPGQELVALRGQYTARTVDDCLRSFGHWQVPIQNFMCADRKNIGWVHAGFVPNRRAGEGRFIMDGRVKVSGLTESASELPMSKNPKQGYLLSANQKIVPPDYPLYLGWDYEPPFRGMTIRRFLQGKEELSAEALVALQNESLDMQAELMLPHLLRNLDVSSLKAEEQNWIAKLRQWDFKIHSEQAEPVLYKAWWKAFKEELFADDLGENANLLYPKDMRVAWLLDRLGKNPQDPDAKWVDNKLTLTHTESLSEIVTAAFRKSVQEIKTELGVDAGKWAWTDWNNVRFTHVGRLPGFGSEVMAMNGSSETVRGQGGRHGAVYKIVVATGDWPKAWIQVPGGNEGDPFSPHYERFVKDWSEGKMRPVEYYRSQQEAEQRAARIIHLKPGPKP